MQEKQMKWQINSVCVFCLFLFIGVEINRALAVKRRCRAPPKIKHAIPLETVTPRKTFPHGSVLTYKCDVGKMATGNGTTVCDNGRWTAVGFKCAVKINCIIPRGSWFRRSIYRQRSGSHENYPAGSKVSDGTEIVAICKRDVYNDVITNWTVTKCNDGKWVPKLPSCKVKERCRSPPEIKHAKPSDTVTPRKTFPHGTILKYTCDVGKMATGKSIIVCDNGRWIAAGFKCEGTTSPTKTDNDELDELCSRLTVNNGQTVVRDASVGTYDVKCDKGYRLTSEKVYECRDGKWFGEKPDCRKVSAKCKFPAALRTGSVLRRKGTREIINTMFVDHWTQAVQTCKKKSRGVTSRIVRCVNGRWRPNLMPCRHKHASVAMLKNTTPKAAETTATTTTSSTVKPNLLRTKIIKPPADQKVVRGSTAKFNCKVNHDPNVQVTWSWRHSRLGSVISSDSRGRMRSNPDGTLIIYSIGPDDAGSYTCVVTSSSGNDNRTATLKVIELPQAPFITSVQLHTDDQRAVSVKWVPGFDGNTPVKRFTLQFKEVWTISEIDGWVSFDSDIEPTAREATVTGLIPGKRYQFRVFASNEVGEGQPSDPKPIPAIQIPQDNSDISTRITLPPEDQKIVKGSVVTFYCGVTRDPSVRVTWKWSTCRLYSDNCAEIKPDSRHVIEPDGTFTLSDVERTDNGNYTCHVTSAGGDDTRTALLTVIELPQAPFVLSVKLHPHDMGSVNIKWIPGHDGNTPVISFSVQYREVIFGNMGNGTIYLGWIAAGSDVQPTFREATVTGLLPNKRYQFRVFASNGVGDGPSSNPKPIPAMQIPQENDHVAVITDITAKATETATTRSIVKPIEHKTLSRLDDDVTVITDTNYTAAETTTTTTTTTSHLKPSTEYRIHVQVTQGSALPSHIILDGNLNRSVKLALDSPENVEGLSMYTVKGIDVGEIERISTSSTYNADVNFVSVHNPDVSGYYFQRFEKFDPGRPQEMKKPCKRQYSKNLEMQPYSPHVKGKLFRSVKDNIDCKLLCIEELEFNCEVAFHHKAHHSCFVLEKYDTHNYKNVPRSGKDMIFMFKREDTCKIATQ